MAEISNNLLYFIYIYWFSSVFIFLFSLFMLIHLLASYGDIHRDVKAIHILVEMVSPSY